MKQKIVITVPVKEQKSFFSCFNFLCDGAGGSKAFQIAAGFSGVDRAAYVGNSRDKIEVAGDGVDAVKLTTKLQKKVGFAALESVTEVK
ncbi:hypothetical protein SAY87_012189 [Trapa incisa]|uniref:Uncharacterized protein n=1 Tax=Trapa incisa TaxID=236973 RepID=A0AAN7GT14_9MYRT|nr:hypothetical protein SAY87_012189 [Trapa incisa]